MNAGMFSYHIFLIKKIFFPFKKDNILTRMGMVMSAKELEMVSLSRGMMTDLT